MDPELPPGMEGWYMMHRLGKMYGAPPDAFSHMTMGDALLWTDLDKYSNHMERRAFEAVQKRAQRENR